MKGKWPYSYCFVECCFQDLFKTAHSILLLFPSSFFSMQFISILVVHPYSSMETATALKKFGFILSVRSDFHLIDNLSITFYTFTKCMLTSLSVDEVLLPRYVDLSMSVDGSFMFKTYILCFICMHIEANASNCLL